MNHKSKISKKIFEYSELEIAKLEIVKLDLQNYA